MLLLQPWQQLVVAVAIHSSACAWQLLVLYMLGQQQKPLCGTYITFVDDITCACC
jgi:hypothetical protein